MNALAEIVNSLSGYDRIIVTGPQRSGTTIAAKILSCELDYRFVPEEEVGGSSLERLFDLFRAERRFVIQGPCFCAYAHLVPGAVVLMRRPLDEILRSQARISWSKHEKAELDRYFATEGPIAQVKYDAWDRFQKGRLRERAFELDYHSLREHALWVEEEQRRHFRPRQISHTGANGAIAALERDLQLKPTKANGHHREKLNGKIRRKPGRNRGKSGAF